MPILSWRDLTRIYDGNPAVDHVTLDVDEGELVAILGPSGSGKSTLLRLTAGLEMPDEGSVLLDGRDVRDVPPHQRGIGLMFQDYNLFPHLTVEQNIAFGLRMQHLAAAARRERIGAMLRLVRLEGFGRRDVLSLSGGEQQRVALARSLAPEPRLLMHDEPLGALDVAQRAVLLEELAEILREVGVTVLYVTHDHDEAFAVATRIAVVDHGRLVQAGSAVDLVERPAHAFVASFLGLGCLVDGRLERSDGRDIFHCALGTVPVAGPEQRGVGGGFKLLVRPSAVRTAVVEGFLPVGARVLSLRARIGGAVARLALLGADGGPYEIDVPVTGSTGSTSWVAGREVRVWLDPTACRVVPG